MEEEKILLNGKKNLKSYFAMMGIVILYTAIYSTSFFAFNICNSMLDFLFIIMFSMLLIFILIMGLKITLSYFNDEVYLTNKAIILKRGKKTFNFPLEDVIKLSGGLKKDADVSNTNLSKNLVDEMVIIIYTKDEINSMTTGNTTIKYIDKECICPVIENNSCISDAVTNFEVIEEVSDKISLNKATLEELMTLKGIGESKAKSIIEYREKTPFKNIEELLNVKGIGKAMFEKIKVHISI